MAQNRLGGKREKKITLCNELSFNSNYINPKKGHIKMWNRKTKISDEYHRNPRIEIPI